MATDEVARLRAALIERVLYEVADAQANGIPLPIKVDDALQALEDDGWSCPEESALSATKEPAR